TIAMRHISEVFRSQIVVLLPGTGGESLVAWGNGQFALDSNELGVAKWVHEHHQPAGLGTSTLPGAAALYLPLQAPRGPVGVLGIRPADRHALDSPDQLHQLETFANQTALAIERAHLADEAQQAQVRIETERLRNSLLSSVSHDLRTPLATITGAATTMLENGTTIDARTRQELLESVREEADRLNRLVQNLLEMTRLESGALQLRKEWHPLEEVIGSALSRLGKELADRRVETVVAPASVSRSRWASSRRTAGTSGRRICPRAAWRFSSRFHSPASRRPLCPRMPDPVVVVIEDEPQIRKFLRATLEGQGYRLFEATTGADRSEEHTSELQSRGHLV